MAWNLVDIPNEEFITQKAWEVFKRNHALKAMIHNMLVSRLHSRQCALESVSSDDLRGLQEAIKELKQILEYIHKGESEEERKTYEQRQPKPA